MKTSLIGALCVLLATQADAGGWTGEMSVTSAFTEGTSDFVVAYTEGGGVYASGCAANAWVFLADWEERRGRAYATLLTALTAGKKIKFWYSDSCSTWGYHGATMDERVIQRALSHLKAHQAYLN